MSLPRKENESLKAPTQQEEGGSRLETKDFALFELM